MKKQSLILASVVVLGFSTYAGSVSCKDANNAIWYGHVFGSAEIALSGIGQASGDTLTIPMLVKVSTSSSTYTSFTVTQLGYTEIYNGSSYSSVSYDGFKGTDFTAKNLFISEGIVKINKQAFCECRTLRQVQIPASVTYIGANAFDGCNNLTNITFMGDMPTLDDDAFTGTPRRMSLTVGKDSIGWDYYKKNGLTAPWEDRKVIKPGYPSGGDEPVSAIVALATTNVVIHYLTTNVPVNVVAPISRDTCIVNVMTEIKGGNIAIPDTWAKNYPNFEKRFGNDFSAALTKYTGKYDGAGNPMFVWQDYVAGTDPTDVYDVFKATITMVGDVPDVQWDPVLIPSEAEKRTYRKFGKVRLQDEWVEIPAGGEADYNFFKVTVEMKQ